MVGEKTRINAVHSVVALMAKDFQCSYRDLDYDKNENLV
jgi:hypothetical protein